MKELQLPEVVTNTVRQGIEAYSGIIQNQEFDYRQVEIDCSRLVTPDWRKHAPLPSYVNSILEQLPSNDKPCLYYYETMNKEAKDVLNAYRDFRKDKNFALRSSATLKKIPPLGTKILYVGKVKDEIHGRTIVHLGYYYKGTTAGLQFVCWANKIGLKVKLHVYSFDNKMHDFVSPLELSFARTLIPLIGKQ